MASYATWIQGILRISSSGRSGSTAQAYDLADRTRETFPAALAQALRAAGIKGGEVYLATDTSLIVPSLEELPPAGAGVTRTLLLRRAEKAKIYDEAVTVGFTEVGRPSLGQPRRVLAHVAPLAWVEEIEKELLAAGFFFSGLFSAALAMQAEGRTGGAGPGKKAQLVLADAESGLLFVVLDPSGAPLFYRTLALARERGPAEIAKEIRRLQLFAEQKLGRPVGTVLSTGTTAQQLLQAAPPVENMAVEAGPAALGPDHYLRWLGKVRSGQTDNVLPAKISGRARRDQLEKLLHLGLLVFLAVGLTWFSTRLIQRGNLAEQTRKLEAERIVRQRQVDAAIYQQTRFRQQKEAVRIVEEETSVPVAELVFRDLAERLPPELHLTRFLIELDHERAKGATATPVYQIRIEGSVARANVQEVKPSVERLCDQLAKSPWKITVLKRTGQSDKDPEVPAELKEKGRFYVFGMLKE